MNRTGRYYGISDERMAEKTIAEADVLVNVSGACWLRPVTAGIKTKLFLDGDPMFTQIKLSRGEQRIPGSRPAPTSNISPLGSMSGSPDAKSL